MVSWVKVGSNGLLFLLVFGMSASVDVESFQRQFNKKSGILVGLSCQFVLLPFLGFCTVKAFDLNEELGLILLVVTSSPGGSYSNWWCSLFNADLALSVAMTTASTIISMAMLPLNLLIYISSTYGQSVPIDWAGLFLSIGVVVAAILGGLSLSYRKPTWRGLFNKLGNVAGILMILFSLFISSSGSDEDSAIWERDWVFYVSTSLPCLGGVALALAITSLPRFELSRPERVAVCVECCYQNVGLAQAVALTMFDDDESAAEAVGVPLFYGAVEAIVVGAFLVLSWQAGWTYAPRNLPLHVVMAQNFQGMPDIIRGMNWSADHIAAAMKLEPPGAEGPLSSESAVTVSAAAAAVQSLGSVASGKDKPPISSEKSGLHEPDVTGAALGGGGGAEVDAA